MPIAFVNSADLGNNGGSTNSLSASYTVGSGANRLLLIGFEGDITGSGADDITGVTYNSVSATLLAKVTTGTSGSNRYHYLYGLLAPTSGANTVQITSTSNHYLMACVVEYSGVSQFGLPDAIITQDPGVIANTSTTTLTTVANNCWAVLFSEQFSSGGNPPPTAVSGATFRGAEPAFFDSGGPISPAASYSMVISTVGTNLVNLLTIMVSIAPSGSKTYFVSSAGSDSNNGTTTGTPWQTITKVNAGVYNGGDTISFAGGQSFTGGIAMGASGSSVAQTWNPSQINSDNTLSA